MDPTQVDELAHQRPRKIGATAGDELVEPHPGIFGSGGKSVDVSGHVPAQKIP
jgi:hypothetical protein